MLHATEKRHQKRYGEVHDKPLVNGDNGIVFSGGSDNNGESSIHGGDILAQIGANFLLLPYRLILPVVEEPNFINRDSRIFLK